MSVYPENIFIQEVLSSYPQRGSLMGLDIGKKRIGVAISDGTWTIASPLETIERTTFSYVLQYLKIKIKDLSIIGIIVGLPLNMNGSQGRSVQSVRHFVYNLIKEISLPILLWDERLSTFAAEEALLEANLSRSKRALLTDKVAAAIILQTFLDKIHNPQKHPRAIP